MAYGGDGQRAALPGSRGQELPIAQPEFTASHLELAAG